MLPRRQSAGNVGSFLGKSVDLGWGRVYGGQTMAQGLAAAQHMAGEGRSIHQFGCHFLKAGDVNTDIEFKVDELTSGRSFGVYHVRALQVRKGGSEESE
jgi:acyl-CoA thioesterase II